METPLIDRLHHAKIVAARKEVTKARFSYVHVWLDGDPAERAMDRLELAIATLKTLEARNG